MRTSMTYPIRFWALLLTVLLIFQFASRASADWCKFEKDIDLTLDVSGSELVDVAATAGDLEIIGVSQSSQIVIHGKACASKQSWLDASHVNVTAGPRAHISVELPATDSDWSLFGTRYAWIDLSIKVPQELALEIKDSSGDISLMNVASVALQDSSGDIEIEDARDNISIRDSSGDIEVKKSMGDLTIVADSSGDIDANNISGVVLVKQDSSGDINASHVSGDVIVEKDSSGDISASDVGGNFRVIRDGSGSIRSHDVQGEVDLPDLT